MPKYLHLRPIWLIALIATAVRFVFAAFIPLTEDEAYYRLWALHPSFGYLDHPPMIAWWIAPGLALLPDGPLGVRLITILSGVLATVLVADCAKHLGADTLTQTRAALWFNAMPLVGFGGVLATPDGPATLFWIATVWAILRAGPPTGGASRPHFWLVAGLFAGLGCLSKYTGLFIAPGVVLFLAVTPLGRRWLVRPWPWLAALIAIAVFTPNIFWNAANEWSSFAKQFGRAEASTVHLGYLGELLAAQLVLVSPFIAAFAVKAGFAPARSRVAVLWLTALPFIAYLLWHALHDSVQGNWPSPLYPAFAIIAAFAANCEHQRFWALARRAAAPVGLALSLLVLTTAAIPALDSAIRIAPLKQLRGWPIFITELRRLEVQSAAAWIGTVSYGTAANLGLRSSLPVTQITERKRYGFIDPVSLDGVGLIVDLDRRLTEAQLRTCFGNVRNVGTLERRGAARVVARYVVFQVGLVQSDVTSSGCPALERDISR